METIYDIEIKKSQLLDEAFNKGDFYIYYMGDTVIVSEAEKELKKKFDQLDVAIDDYRHDDCGCGERVRINVMKSLLNDIEGIIKSMD
jgi:hypothetical protein